MQHTGADDWTLWHSKPEAQQVCVSHMAPGPSGMLQSPLQQTSAPETQQVPLQHDPWQAPQPPEVVDPPVELPAPVVPPIVEPPVVEVPKVELLEVVEPPVVPTAATEPLVVPLVGTHTLFAADEQK
jgi:hypothetical protein